MKKFISFFLFAILTASNLFAQMLPVKGICAHRGASLTHPENTIASIKEAINLGAQMIEFDLRTTKDKRLVVIHNKSVDKTTNGKGEISELTLEEIKTLDAGLWKGREFEGEKIPTFEEVLDIIPDTIWMNIHIKENVKTAEAAAEILTKRNKTDNAFLAVENKSAQVIRRINRKIKICCMERGNSTEEYLQNAIEIKADYIQLTEREYPVLEKIIPKLKENNIKINFYYADTIDKFNLLISAGVDFILTNNVKTLVNEAFKTNFIE